MAVRAVELLGLLLCYVSVPVALGEDVLDDLSLERRAGASEMIKWDIEPFVDLLMDLMIAVAELAWGDTS